MAGQNRISHLKKGRCITNANSKSNDKRTNRAPKQPRTAAKKQPHDTAANNRVSGEPMYVVVLPGTAAAASLKNSDSIFEVPTQTRNGQIFVTGTAWAFDAQYELDGDYHIYYRPVNKASSDLLLYDDRDFAEQCLQRETLWLEIRKRDVAEFVHTRSLYTLNQIYKKMLFEENTKIQEER